MVKHAFLKHIPLGTGIGSSNGMRFRNVKPAMSSRATNLTKCGTWDCRLMIEQNAESSMSSKAMFLSSWQSEE